MELNIEDVSLKGLGPKVDDELDAAFDLDRPASEKADRPPEAIEFDPFSTRDIVDPITGEIVDPSSIDDLIECLRRLKKNADVLEAAMNDVKRNLVSKCTGKQKTQYVVGTRDPKRNRVKVEFHGLDFEQPALKHLIEKYPERTKDLIKVERYKVALREYQKITTSSGDDAFEEFKKLVLLAGHPSSRTPYVKLDEKE